MDYKAIVDLLDIFGDTVISFEGGDFVTNLPNAEFRSYRFESLDGVTYCFYVDGATFTCGTKTGGDEYASLRLHGKGGCDLDLLPTVNKWDFVRYGTISYGEQIIESDPPSGFLDARTSSPLDRFTVRYDQPNYAYVDEITVETTNGAPPTVTKTRRLDNGPPDVVEIVLNRPIPFGETTTFTFDDGVATNVIEFTFAPGDTDGDGDADLYDVAVFQNCFGKPELLGACHALDSVRDATIDIEDYADFNAVLLGPLETESSRHPFSMQRPRKSRRER